MNPAVTNLVIMLVMMQVSKRIDFEDPTILFYVRALYVSCTAITLLVYLYTRHLIIKKNDLTTLKYLEPANAMAGETEPKLNVTTVMDYDLKQMQGSIKGVFTGVAMMGFMHLYMKYANPLLMQSISPLKSAFESNLVQIHVFGKAAAGDLKRPFKSGGGLMSMLSGGNNDIKTDKASIEKAEVSGAGGVKEE